MRHQGGTGRRVVAVAATVAMGWLVTPVDGPGTVGAQETPVPVRNDVARALGPDDEVAMLRHHRLRKGAHEPFLQLSALAVWPWFARIGARITGQWVVVDPEGRRTFDHDEVYRLARYASFEHWQQTRGVRSTTLGGNGPARARNTEALRLRRAFQVETDGGYFLQGRTATTRPIFLPGVAGERYEPSPEPSDVIATRHDVAARSGPELVTLTYRRIRKGTFARLAARTETAVWPFEEKLGARPIGHWRVIYPPADNRTTESPDYDETIAMTRYASYAHYVALRPDVAARLGGNGPDWEAWRDALAERERLTVGDTTRTEFLQGALHQSPPSYLPALRETYRLRDEG